MESRVPSLRGGGNERPLTVEVAQAPSEERRQPPQACVVAIGPLDGPWLSDAFPDAVVKKSRFDSLPVGVEQVRFTSRSVVDRLPGLDNRNGPSLLRDAVNGILTAGAPSVDVVVGRVIGGKPWSYDDERVFRVLDGYLQEMPGTVLVFPDLHGPRGPQSADFDEERFERIATAIDRFSDGWHERYQIALIDDPGLPAPLTRRLIPRLLGTDLAVCRFTGSDAAMAAHSWRCAGAVAAGLVTAGSRAVLGMIGQSAQLGEARRAPARRADLLLRTDPARVAPEFSEYFLELALDDTRNMAQIITEPTFRRPMGGWPFSALRMVKAVHQRIIDSAQQFVFQPADPRSALALAGALQYSVRPFSNAGLLVGPEGMPEPLVSGNIEVAPDGSRTLVADVMGNLRPWSRKVSVRVSLRPNESPALEVL